MKKALIITTIIPLIFLFSACKKRPEMKPIPHHKPITQKVITPDAGSTQPDIQIIEIKVPEKKLSPKTAETIGKLHEVKRLKENLRDKIKDLQANSAILETKIQKFVTKIKEEKKKTGQDEFSEIIRNERIKIALEALQKAHIYKKILAETIRHTKQSEINLEGMENQLDLDITLLSSLDDQEINKVLDRLNLVITKYQPDTKKLVLPPDQETDLKQLDQIYDIYIRAEEQRQKEEQEKKRQQELELERQHLQELERQKKLVPKQDTEQKPTAAPKPPQTISVAVTPETNPEDIKVFQAKFTVDFSAKKLGNISSIVWSHEPNTIAIVQPQRLTILNLLLGKRSIWSPKLGFDQSPENTNDDFCSLFSDESKTDIDCEFSSVVWSPNNRYLAIISKRNAECNSVLAIWSFEEKKYVVKTIIHTKKDHCQDEPFTFVGWENDRLIIKDHNQMFLATFRLEPTPQIEIKHLFDNVSSILWPNPITIFVQQNNDQSTTKHITLEFDLKLDKIIHQYNECSTDKTRDPTTEQCTGQLKVTSMINYQNQLFVFTLRENTFSISTWNVKTGNLENRRVINKTSEIFKDDHGYFPYIMYIVTGQSTFKPFSDQNPDLVLAFSTTNKALDQKLKATKKQYAMINNIRTGRTIAIIDLGALKQSRTIIWDHDQNQALTWDDQGIFVWDLSELY